MSNESQYPNMQTDPAMMYSIATRLKKRSQEISDTWGSPSTQESLAAKLNDMGNKILVANGGR